MPGFLKIVQRKKSNKKTVTSKATKRSSQEAPAVSIPVKALYGAMIMSRLDAHYHGRKTMSIFITNHQLFHSAFHTIIPHIAACNSYYLTRSLPLISIS
ncbi:unnamed protein product [Umbelopsis ramanniana]